ncbi:SpoVR family protein [Magnetospirillum gryphiswaldense]|uniref:SpoVR like family protein n=1 Tax=Magnetospirillum gryphiswaldense TaxID=55518 RepID=A4U0N9_9PROT|nr:SpoVR family protein [Magnetospirillum gryphiswaldense]AVM74220.1 SpoVR family protein [Magnetospirillum gryphiswaldense MSR-1]AVM78123.1 SpoVR family protein [Magnetospirillum gryphiswaldense]CAM76446.1 SpoVR like family protein [Magnetospirillum gryphiswaldense MSR-1]
MSRHDGPGKLLFTGADWNFDKLQRTHDAIARIAHDELGLDTYPNQIEVITAEQMLDAYSSIGMPLMYKHWSFGKHFAADETLYRKGMRGLAYEIVINSSPCISYVMEENSMAMQTLVVAHAAFGHNHFFKNNALFRQWTDAKGILDYLDFAKGYIQHAEERHGQRAVERVLDAAHALMSHGVHKYPRKRPFDLAEDKRREKERQDWFQQNYNDLWRTLPKAGISAPVDEDLAERKHALGLPEENILYFLEKSAPLLAPWQREILRIVRNIAQYFYPQKQTKVMNEGCATMVHYTIANRLHEQGRIDDGTLMEILHSHTNVVFQPGFDDPRYTGLNPYALGFAMMQDIARICTQPTAEDCAWFPDFAGNNDPWATLRHAWADYRDESFILQFLSPAVMRKLRLFHLHDEAEDDDMVVKAIHDERGYRQVRQTLARSYDIGALEADIQVADVDLSGDRRLIVHHRVANGILLDSAQAGHTLRHLANLWGYPVQLVEVDEDGAVLHICEDVGPV